MMRWVSFALALLLTACASGPKLQNQAMVRGFNAMQHSNVAWTDERAATSLRRMQATGANAVVFVPFMKQERPTSVNLRGSRAVTTEQLRAAVRHARRAGLKVMIKPQILIPGSWAGEVDHRTQYEWDAWFISYSQLVLDYARLAESEGAYAFVIGTELKRAASHVRWPELIRQVRQVFHGEVTYAAHNIDSMRAFPYWHLLDAVSLTFYPSLGKEGSYDEMYAMASAKAEELHATAAAFGKPLWVLEIGMPSARGASAHPWQWQGLDKERVDLRVQRDALDIWLKVLDQPWVSAFFIWAWYSDDHAGGSGDTDYTPQNKPAERVIAQYWRS